ncbi:UBA/THIF-type NAD/FAD binding protein [Acidovorax delafieldii 2AN]|uniref:UBA/THIF-type NAD/FAD binding protein n=1 Tax=Acidovorax delafieldii 2AN TaxID=573060 RepID=C5T056_ACIDE|nr:PRTRC system ThiF family protein [Acidovorax delafieldii]EER62164.1 UBA/THIF-type NAD/FAD binding protein [Acidovorax delafieldii 2AN]
MEHLIHPKLLERRVAVHLIGVGGNGAQMAACLARLDIAMRALGHPLGLHVTAFDADRVSEANVGRQLYSAADIGRHKALVTIHRLNQFYGLDWEAYPMRYEEFVFGHRYAASADLLVSCVDSRSARQTLHRLAWRDVNRYDYWLDLGNTESTAQVVLGEPGGGMGAGRGMQGPRLPCVTELFPELLDVAAPEDNQPSCSVRMSLASQGLFVNDVAVRYAAQLLYELFSKGRLSAHGVVVNLDSKRSGPIEVDPRTWARFGFRHEDVERQQSELETIAEE